MAKKEYGTRKKYHFIYKTTNLLSGRYYIGMHSTDDLNDGYLGSGTYLKRSINKHGKENHSIEILEFVNSREELAAREKEIVSLQEIAKKECMNLKVGGEGGFSREWIDKGRELANKAKAKLINEDPEFREKYYKAIQEGIKKAKERGVKFSNISENFSWEGKRHRPETLEKMRNTRKERDLGKGPSNSQYGTCWITNEVESKKIYKGTIIPEGWRLGRKVKNNIEL